MQTGQEQQPGGATIPYAAALKMSIALHQQRHLEAAEDLYRRILDTYGEQPDALHFLGVLRHQRGASDEAVRLIEAALQQAPRHADAHNNLGNIHKECERLDQAEASYRRALECDPEHLNSTLNLALVLEALERPEEAYRVLVALLESAPESPLGLQRMGRFLSNFAQGSEHLEQAVTCYRKALEFDDDDNTSRRQLGMLLYMVDRHDEAQGVYRDWVEREPENPIPRHMLAANGAAPAPARATDAYVRTVFDDFAESFDEQLLQNLNYRAPELLATALNGVLGPPASALDILDAGCGTGLCGPWIKPQARHLSGVDLSEGMVAKARARGDYDELAVAELTDYMTSHAEAYDLVLSADTLVYFGDLAAVVAAAYAALRPGGWLGFTLEALDQAGDALTLSSSGRYCHSKAHVATRLEAAGFSNIEIQAQTFRKELGQPVSGWLVMARRGGGAA